jgi:simple sugar transport system ATP-binding protein
VSRAALAEMMVGRDTTKAHTPNAQLPGAVRLEVRGLRGPGLDGIAFSLRAGEILGVAGVDGNGQLELADTLAGLRVAEGSVVLDGVEISQASPAARVRAGLAYLPADRARTSLVRSMTVSENLALRDGDGFWLHPAALAARAREKMAAYDIRAPGPDTIAARLSGGNQQKIVVARELDRAPAVVIAHQAAWGLDPGATRFVLDRVVDLRNQGAAVLYISSELEEVLAISDRVAVLFGGRIAGVLPRAEADLGRIGLWMAGQG